MKQLCGSNKDGTPKGSVLKTAPSGRSYYLSGIDAEKNEAILRYTDGAQEFLRIDLREFNKRGK